MVWQLSVLFNARALNKTDRSALHVILGICALDWNILLTPKMNVTEG